MRYYNIIFTPAKGEKVPENIAGFLNYSSIKKSASIAPSSFNPNGFNNPGAFEIEFHIESGPIDQAIPNGFLRIYNPPAEVVRNAASYQGMDVQIFAGFNDDYRSGFLTVYEPNLQAVPALGSGRVFMSFANWMAGDWAIDMYIGPMISYSGLLSQNNKTTTYTFGWVPDNMIQDYGLTSGVKTLAGALTNAFITKDSSGNITSTIKNIVFRGANELENLGTSKPYVWQGTDLTKFGEYFRAITSEQLVNGGDTYLNGLTFTIVSDTIYVINSNNPNVTTIYKMPSTNIIGQPTISYNDGALEIQTVHPMDANIKPNGMGIQISINEDFIITNATKAANPYKNLSIKNQVLRVQKVTHMGKFRDASYQGWVTVANLAYIPGVSIQGQ